MKIYTRDKRFAIEELKSGWVRVLILENGKYEVNYTLIDLESAYQCIWDLSGRKRFVSEKDFKEKE
jgi:hypothetical protein